MQRMLIDGKLVTAEADRTYPSVNPATGQVIDQAPDASVADAQAAIAAARRAFDTTSWADRRRVPRPLPGPAAPGADRAQGGAARADDRRRRRAPGDHLRRPARRADRDRPLLRRPAARLPADPGDRRARVPRPAAPPLDGEGAGRRRRRDHRLQLPDPAGAGQAVARARGRLHGGAQGRAGHPADHARAGRADRRAHRHPAGRGQRDLVVLGRGRRGADHLARRGRGDVHRLHRDRPRDHGRRVSATIKRVFLELGGKSALVVLDDADLRGPIGTATFATCSHAGQGCAIPTRMVVPRAQHDAIVEQVAAGLRQRGLRRPGRPGQLHGPADQRAAAGQGRRHGPAGGRGRRHPGDRRREGRTRATSTPRRCSPTWTRTARSPRKRRSGRSW